MGEDKTTNTMEAPRGLTIESQMVLLPGVNIIIKIFLLGDSSTHTLTKDTTGGTPLPHFLYQHSTTLWPVMMWVGQ